MGEVADHAHRAFGCGLKPAKPVPLVVPYPKTAAPGRSNAGQVPAAVNLGAVGVHPVAASRLAEFDKVPSLLYTTLAQRAGRALSGVPVWLGAKVYDSALLTSSVDEHSR